MIFVVSTTGQGDTPDSMKVYCDSILNIKKNWRSSGVDCSNLFHLSLILICFAGNLEVSFAEKS